MGFPSTSAESSLHGSFFSAFITFHPKRRWTRGPCQTLCTEMHQHIPHMCCLRKLCSHARAILRQRQTIIRVSKPSATLLLFLTICLGMGVLASARGHNVPCGLVGGRPKLGESRRNCNRQEAMCAVRGARATLQHCHLLLKMLCAIQVLSFSITFSRHSLSLHSILCTYVM